MISQEDVDRWVETGRKSIRDGHNPPSSLHAIVHLADRLAAIEPHVTGFKEWEGPAVGASYHIVDRLRGIYLTNGFERRFGVSPINVEAAAEIVSLTEQLAEAAALLSVDDRHRGACRFADFDPTGSDCLAQDPVAAESKACWEHRRRAFVVKHFPTKGT